MNGNGERLEPPDLSHYKESSRLREGLLDKGADDTVFPESLATHLGIDLSNAPVGSATTANLANFPLR